jgi:hypothetical protein
VNLFGHDHHVSHRHRYAAHWIGYQQPILTPGRLNAPHEPFGWPRSATPEKRHQLHRRQGNLACNDLIATADRSDAGQDPEPACIGPPRDICDVAAPARRGFVKGEVNTGRQSHVCNILK